MSETKIASPGRRQRLLMAGALVVMVGYAGTLVYRQAIDGPETAAQGLNIRVQQEDLLGKRGDLLTSDGQLLATSVERYAIEADQRQIPDYSRADSKTKKVVSAGLEGASKDIAEILQSDPATIRKALDGDKQYSVVAKEATPQQWDALKAMNINGLYATKFYKRTYPSGALAGNLVGYGFEDEAGKEKYAGLEGTQNKLLQSKDGERKTERGLLGQQIPGGMSEYEKPKNGCSVQLTLNADIQWKAQQAIDAQVQASEAAWGSVVISDPRSGEILALADSNALDPSNLKGSEGKKLGSWAIENPYEPGSTGKAFTAAALIDTGKAGPETRYQVPGSPWTAPSGQSFKDDWERGAEQMTLAGIVAKSSNIGTVLAGEPLTDQERYDYLTRFGFGQETGIELPGESSGLLGTPDSWDGRTRDAILFGQGIATTSMQNVQAYGVFGNGGIKMPLHLIKGHTCEDGKFQPNKAVAGQRVISPESAAQTVRVLEGVVAEGGTGRSAGIPGYRVAGKTGTAEQLGDGGKYAAHFIGIVPADDPQLVIDVIIYNPLNDIYGARSASPVFADVGSYALQQLGIAPSGVPADPYPRS